MTSKQRVVQCGVCQRTGFDRAEFAQPCGTLKPDGSRCTGQMHHWPAKTTITFEELTELRRRADETDGDFTELEHRRIALDEAYDLLTCARPAEHLEDATPDEWYAQRAAWYARNTGAQSSPEEPTGQDMVLMRAAGWLAAPKGESRQETINLIRALVARVKNLTPVEPKPQHKRGCASLYRHGEKQPCDCGAVNGSRDE